MPPITALLLDVDGTLVDTWDLYVEAYTRTLAPHLGHRPTLEELRALEPTSEIRFLERAVAREEERGRIHGDFLDHYRALHASHFGGVYPGVRETLAELRELPVSLGIVTGKSRGAWAVTGALAELGSFEVVVCDDDVEAEKPDPGGLLQALEALGVEPGHAVYVGDSVKDARAARGAGMAFGAALWPKSAAERDAFVRSVREAGVWRLLERPEELIGEVAGPGAQP